MKAIFKNMVQAYSGKCDGLVYYYNRKFNRVVVRKYVKPKPTAQHSVFRSTCQNLKSLEISEAYKQDLKDYTCLYMRRNEKGRRNISNWYNLFIMLMWAMAKELSLDLLTITRADIENGNLPCRTVKQAVEADLIPSVNNYETLTHQL